MKMFQDYLTNLPSEVYSTTQFLRYYALPYIPDHAITSSFKELFDGRWHLNLKERMSNFIKNVQGKSANLPTLIRALSGVSLVD